jgi:hypothetical protein
LRISRYGKSAKFNPSEIKTINSVSSSENTVARIHAPANVIFTGFARKFVPAKSNDTTVYYEIKDDGNLAYSLLWTYVMKRE